MEVTMKALGIECLSWMLAICLAPFMPRKASAEAASSDVQTILAHHAGVYSHPPVTVGLIDPSIKAYRVPDGPLMGNGDLAVAVGGTYTNQTFYLSKSDLSQSARGVGGLTYTFDGLAADGTNYRQEQDLYHAEVRSVIPLRQTTVRMRSWTADASNILVTELWTEAGVPLEVSLSLWSHANASTTQAGTENGIIWSTREITNKLGTPAQPFSSKVAMATRKLGAVPVCSTDGKKSSVAKFTLQAGKTVNVFTVVSGGYQATNHIGTAKELAASLTQCALPVAEANGKTINVLSFGAKGDGVTNDAPALNRAIAEAVRLGPGTTVLMPKGRYHLENASGCHLLIRDARGLTVQGEPGTVLVAQNPDDHIVKLANCTVTTLKQLVLEQENTYFTQGTIDAMSADGKSCEVSIDPHYPEPDAPHLAQLRTLRSFSNADTTSYRQDHWWPTVKSCTRTGDRQWHFEIEGWALVQDMAKKPFIIWDDKHSSHGVSIEKCSDCLIEDVTYYGRGANAGLFIMNCSGTITMRRFNILTPPGSGALLSCSGGGQMIDCRGSLVWEDCWFDKVDDDGADVFTGYNRILKQIDARTLLVEGRRGYATNDQVAILDWPTRVDRHQAAVVSCVRQDDGSTKLVVDRDVTVLRTGPGSGKDWKKAKDDGVDRVVDYNLACSSVTFRSRARMAVTICSPAAGIKPEATTAGSARRPSMQ